MEENKIEHNCSNFIYEQRNALSSEVCQTIIKGFDGEVTRAGYVRYGNSQFATGALGRADEQVFCPPCYPNFHAEIMDVVWKGVDQYAGFINSVGSSGPYYIGEFKVQKTDIGGGYHTWHCEQGPNDSANRALVWSIYLNDVNEGGETEFLYQSMRVRASEGTLVIWPAGITHPHRGNPPISNTKFIITGWVNCPSSSMVSFAMQNTEGFTDER